MSGSTSPPALSGPERELIPLVKVDQTQSACPNDCRGSVGRALDQSAEPARMTRSGGEINNLQENLSGEKKS